MLYDAGPNQAANTIISYLKSHSVSEIDALVLSHPDSDHIGAADEVIESFTIGSFYMPKVVHSTQSYLDVLSAAKAKKADHKDCTKRSHHFVGSGCKGNHVGSCEGLRS